MNTHYLPITTGAKISCALFITALSAHAVTSFTENFNSDNANWRLNTATVTDFVPNAGNGYISVTRNFSTVAANSGSILFRAQDEFNSSGNAFAGNYLTDNITTLTAQFRHNLPGDLQIFTRLANPANFPGATANRTLAIAPNVWTTITVDINVSNAEFVTFEGSDFAGVFSNIGHVQFGITVPATLGATPIAGSATNYTFDLDSVSITAVPEPSALFLLSLGGLAALRRKR